MTSLAYVPDRGQSAPTSIVRPFDKVPRDIAGDERVNCTAYRVFAIVVRFAGLKDGCTAGNDRIGKAAGNLSHRTVQRALEDLERLGYIRRVLDPTTRSRVRIDVLDISSEQTNNVRQICHTPPGGVGVKSDAGGTSNLTLELDRFERDQENVNVNDPASLPEEDSPEATDDQDAQEPRGRVEAEQPAPEAVPAPATPQRAARTPRPAVRRRDDLARLPGRPEMVEPAARWIAAQLGDDHSVGNLTNLCRAVASGAEPADRLAAAFDAGLAAKGNSKIKKPGSILTKTWNAWRPAGAVDPAEAFYGTNRYWILPAVANGAGGLIDAGMDPDTLRARVTAAADRYAASMRDTYVEERLERLRGAYLLALDEIADLTPDERYRVAKSAERKDCGR